jgi:hypothetical protein
MTTFRWQLAAVVLVVVGLAVGLAVSSLNVHGDGWEYYQTMVSLYEHGTADWQPSDANAALAVYPEDHPGRSLGFVPGDRPGWQPTPDGRVYTIHFWAYPLSGVPAKALLRAAGGNEWAALHVTNLAWLTLGLVAILFLNRRSAGERIAFAVVAVAPPVVTYVWYTGTELYSWSLLTMALVAMGNTRYAVAGLLVGLSGLQNPISLALAVVPFAAALRDRRWWAAAGCTLGGMTGLLTFAFYHAHFGTPTLLVAGYTDRGLISWGRTVSLLVDLNQGLLAYVPVLLLASAAAAIAALVRRQLLQLVALAATAVAMLAVQIQTNWNSDGLGLMRYLVWMIPPLAWVTATTWTGRTRWVIVVASVVIHLGLFALDPPRPGYLHQRVIAKWVLAHAPRLYDPDPEVFTERQCGSERYHPLGLIVLPCGFADDDGNVTKLLVDRESRHLLPEVFEVDPAILPALLEAADRDGRRYLHPPAGSVRLKPEGRLAPVPPPAPLRSPKP